MTDFNQESNALLSEHFGWTPLALIDDVINAVNELLYNCVEGLSDALSKQTPNTLGFKLAPGEMRETDDDGNDLLTARENEELENGIHQLETLLEMGVDRNFDAFELFVLRNILVVDKKLVPWVRLAHHKDAGFASRAELDGDITKNEAILPAAEMHDRLRSLRQKLMASYQLNQSLKQQAAANEKMIEQLRRYVAAANNTSAPGHPETAFSLLAGTKDMQDAAGYAASQISMIKDLVRQVQPRHETLLAHIRSEAVDNGDDSLSTDSERKQYIEKMTRKHMESTRGLRLNARGEIIGGDVDLGEKKSVEEVQRLEEVVGKLGKREE